MSNQEKSELEKLRRTYRMTLNSIVKECGVTKGVRKYSDEMHEVIVDYLGMRSDGWGKKHYLWAINYLLMICAREFGLFIESANEQGTKEITLTEYLQFKNK